MANADTYPTEANPQDTDSLLGIDASASTGSKTNRFLLSVLRTFFGEQKAPVAETSHGFSVGDLVRKTSGSWAKADATTLANAAYVGMVVSVPGTDNFVLQMVGYVTGLSSLTDGTWYFLQDDGSLGATPGTVWCPVLAAVSTTAGFMAPVRPGQNLGDSADFDDTGATTSSIIVRNASSGWQVLKNNITTTAPTTGDDSGDGYDYGSEWIDATAGDVYKCVDPSSGAAVWKKTTP